MEASKSNTAFNSISDPDSLEEAAAQLNPQGRGVFRNIYVLFPLKVLCTEVTFRVPSLHTGHIFLSDKISLQGPQRRLDPD